MTTNDDRDLIHDPLSRIFEWIESEEEQIAAEVDAILRALEDEQEA